MSSSRERYERVLRCIRYQSGSNPCCRLRSVRLALVAHGSFEPAGFASVVRAGRERGEVVVGSGFVCVPRGRGHAVAAVEFVVERVGDASGFVSGVNGWLDSEL